MPLAPGMRLGSYEIEASVEGGDAGGEVYRARDTRLDRTVAIEVLSGGDAARSRLEREARVLSRLRHPRIVSLYDVGETDGARYVVCEWVEGCTLARRLGEGALPLAEALRYGLEMAEALDGGHRQGVAHGSLTPADVMLTDRGVKLRGYGRARLAAPGAESGADAGSDIPALGRILCEMLTGPLDPRLDRTVRRCLQNHPDGAWTSAREVADELRGILEEQRAVAVPAPNVAAPAKRRWLLAALLGAAAAALAYVAQGLR